MSEEQETKTYQVFMTQVVTTVVEVEASSIDAARDAALEQAPSPVNSSNHGIDPSGEWTEQEVYLDGEVVWKDGQDDESAPAS